MADRKHIPNVAWRNGIAHLRILIDGRLVRESLGTRYASEARRRRDIRVAELHGAKWDTAPRQAFEPEPLPLDVLCARFLAEHGPTLRHSTRKDYKQRLDKFRAWAKSRGLTDAGRITADNLARYRAARLKEISEEGALSDMRPVKAAFAYAWQMRWIEENPCARLRGHKRKGGRERHILSWEEISALVKAARPDDVRHCVRIAALAGLRRGELVALEWDDIDRGRGEIHVVNKPWHVTKSGQARSVPLAPQLAKWLPADGAGRVFTSGVCPTDLSKLVSPAFAALRKRYPGERMGLHLLRHTWLSYLALIGVPTAKRMLWAGHTKSDTTDKYTHVRQRVSADDVEAFRLAFLRWP